MGEGSDQQPGGEDPSRDLQTGIGRLAAYSRACKEGCAIDLGEVVESYTLAANSPAYCRRQLSRIRERDLDGDRKPLATDISYPCLQPEKPLIIEGAGGLLVPLNEKEFVLDLAVKLDATLILVSRNYLGSINHSLLTAAVCKAHGLQVAGWIFNDQYLHYEQEIVQWSGIPAIASIPGTELPDTAWIRKQADRIKPQAQSLVGSLY